MASHNAQRGWVGITACLIIAIVITVVVGILYAAQTGRIDLAGLTLPTLNNRSGTLSGIVSVGPLSPICVSGQSCSHVLANYTLEAKNGNGSLVATVKTDTNGAYNMYLAPGVYTIIAVPKVGIGASSVQVTVKSGANRADIILDTGIR